MAADLTGWPTSRATYNNQREDRAMWIKFEYDNVKMEAKVGHYDSSKPNNFGGHPDLMEEEWSEIEFDQLLVYGQDIMTGWDFIAQHHKEGIEAAAWAAIEKEEAEL